MTRFQYIYHMGVRLVMLLGDDSASEPVNISLAGRRGRSTHPAAQPPIRFVKHESNPVLDIPSDGAVQRNSFSISRKDDVWYLWHADQSAGIERLVSTDAMHWTKPADKPVRGLGAFFARGLPLQWDDREVAMPYPLTVTDHVLQRDLLMMYYVGTGNDETSGLGYASFLIGAEARWNKHGFSPLLRGVVANPCVVQVGETFAHWCDQQIEGRTRICRAASTDGGRWTRVKSNPILEIGDNDAWDGGAIIAYNVQWHAGRFHIWYAAT